jgi:methylmalonyl-CoA mutase N-terminal domain/subunit
VNVIRVAIQALAAVLGGTQSLHTNSLDEALALPSEFAVKLALRTQQVIAYESGVTNTVDPLGGSYYVEYLTNRLEQQAYEYFRKIEELGGVIPAIEAGFFQREIAEAAYRYQKEIDEKRRIIVGVNEFVEEEEVKPPILQMDPEGERRQRARLQKLRMERDNERVGQTLAALQEAARKENENLMPYILEAVKAYATLGEITRALKAVWGTWQEPLII